MRRLTLLIAFLLLALPGAAAAQTTFVFTGAGWGHAIGLAQYGTLGFARNGWAYDRILGHYYPGTELGPAPARKVRVLLVAGLPRLGISSASPFRVRDAQGVVVKLPAGTVQLGTDLSLQTPNGSRTLASPLRFVPGRSPLELGGPYRGALVVHLQKGGLAAVNQVGLEPYLKGVVAGEMPAGWHPEALKAQAVAARSYALVSRKTGGIFDLHDDTRSQVYGGIAAERPSTNAAIDATRGQVVLHGGKVAWTFFSASSGGRTAAIEDVWPDSEPLPYLVSVEDPHDDISPYHRWGPVTFTAAELAAKLGSRLPSGLRELRVNPNPSGRVGTVTAVGKNASTEISGWDMRILLGLRSTWFEVTTLGGLAASRRELLYGQAARLTAAVGAAGRVVLEHRPSGQRWRALRELRVRNGGTVRTSVRPKTTTLYRLRLASGRSPAVRVAVAPAVSLAGDAGVLVGSVRPALRGADVTIERRDGSRWQPVAAGRVGRGGRFEVAVPTAAGVFRARIAPVNGLAAGTSPVLALRAR